MIWKCDNCGHELHGEVVHPVHCFCKLPAAIEQSIPYDDWPAWAKLVSLRKIDSDAGVGDTVQRYAAKIGGERFKKLAKRLGIPCGCTERQAQWNVMYPYDLTQAEP